MKTFLFIFLGYTIGRLDAKYGERFGYWCGLKTRHGILFLRSCCRYCFKKPYAIGTLHEGTPIAEVRFDWDFGDWSYGFEGHSLGASHGLVKWYKDRAGDE